MRDGWEKVSGRWMGDRWETDGRRMGDGWEMGRRLIGVCLSHGNCHSGFQIRRQREVVAELSRVRLGREGGLCALAGVPDDSVMKLDPVARCDYLDWHWLSLHRHLLAAAHRLLDGLLDLSHELRRQALFVTPAQQAAHPLQLTLYSFSAGWQRMKASPWGGQASCGASRLASRSCVGARRGTHNAILKDMACGAAGCETAVAAHY